MNGKLSQKSTRAATLMELLTVLAVIAVLAAILIPVSGRVRMMANRAASASNLRQWGVAAALYRVDNRMRMPVEGTATGKSGSLSRNDYAWWSDVGAPVNAKAWFNVLPPYAGEKPLADILPGGSSAGKDAFMREFRQSLFYSPGTTLRESVADMVPMCYFMNSQLYNDYTAVWHGTTESELRVRGVLYSTLEQAGKASAIPFMAEARTENTELVGSQSGGTDVFRARGQSGHVGSRYGQTTNIVFCDGSVRNFKTAYILAPSPAGSGLNGRDKPEIFWRPFNYAPPLE